MNVDELSELFTHIENAEESGIDFSVFIEDEDALNVEEVSDVFSILEDVHDLGTAVRAKEDKSDAENIDAVSDLFSSLEEADNNTSNCVEPTQVDIEDAQNVDFLSEVFSAFEETEIETSSCEQENYVSDSPDACADAQNVDMVADLFTSLEEACPQVESISDVPQKSTQDWIDALEVDKVSNLFSELESDEAGKAPVVVPKVDSRIFVPKFSIKIEGKLPPRTINCFAASTSPFLAGPPQLSVPNVTREDRIGRWKEKRKTRSFVSKPTDSCISGTRRACAAKRQRVKGRFTSEKPAFVPITLLQQ